ncbi:tRNA (guanine(26)-N(2))-dimethyltransferase isoform X2 [Diospyros lotus]|uniref:tRNA (guanine(26)-N(2))-dimethyltransferase isoform X2 n=1 Tax=Diospyros lotus TaxID=55363 RepID=UPI002255DF4C|nr:tRNA (guanine(26)-N(2))-dimethyltransferase isoform X2 [Diospyros lotus]
MAGLNPFAAKMFLSPKSLFPSPFIRQNPNPKLPHSRYNSTLNLKSACRTERGLEFDTGESFFRQESATGRDLGVLAAALYRKSKGKLRVLDAMCGCGIRSLRYLAEAEADFVLANDGNENYRGVILANLSRFPRGFGEAKKWLVTHSEANRVMTECYLRRDYFDLIDIDSFGSDSTFLRSALNALKLDGLLYVTSTDGYSSGGHRPYHALASYGAYIRPVPYSNEVGLRMLIGGVVREASVLGYHVNPLFSYYSYHGPVFRVMLRFNRGKLPNNRHYGFVGYCTQCGHSQTFSWEELGCLNCHCDKANVSNSLVVLGPLWTGPLHTASYLIEMLNLAEQWGWTGNGMGLDLEKLLRQMVDESDPELPPGYVKMDEVARRAKVNSPPIKTMMSIMHEGGYAASRSHIASNAIKTNCPVAECVRIAKELAVAG